MDLSLKLSLDRQDYLHGESILATLTLVNQGKSPANLPSLDMNDTVVSYRLQDSTGKEIGAYDGVDFQKRVGEPRIRRDRVQMQTLAPGDDEEVNQDLLLLREALVPGRYRLSGRYQWKEISLETSPSTFEVHPSKAERPVIGWDSDRGGPFHLLVAWVDHLKGSTLLMQGSTFGADARVLDHASRMRTVQRVEDLAITRDLGKVAEMEGTLIWKEEGKLRWLDAGEGEEGAVGEFAPELPGWRIVPAPYRENENKTLALITSEAGDKVLALALPMGRPASVVGDYKSRPARLQAFVVVPEQGPLYLFASDSGKSEYRIEKVGLGRGGASSVLWSDSRPPLDLAALVDASGQPLAAVASEGGEAEEVFTTLFRGASLEQTLKGPAFRIPKGSRPHLVLGADRSVHLFVEEQGRILYSAGGGAVAPIETGMTYAPGSQFAVGRSGRSFVFGVNPAGAVSLHQLRGPAGTPGVRGQGREGEEEPVAE